MWTYFTQENYENCSSVNLHNLWFQTSLSFFDWILFQTIVFFICLGTIMTNHCSLLPGIMKLHLCYPRMLPHRLVIFCRIYFENILKIFLYTFLCKNLSPFMAPPYLKGPWFKQVRTWIYTTYAFTYVWGFLAERYLRINIKKKLFFMTHLSWPSSTLIWKKNTFN